MVKMNTFRDWQAVLNENAEWQRSDEARAAIVGRLGRLGPGQRDLNVALTALSVGHAMVRAASDWESPIAGAGGKAAAARGTQWRFAMAWAGFEKLLKAGTNTVEASHFPHGKVGDFVSALRFPEGAIPPLRSPKKKGQLFQEWVNSIDAAALRFLHIDARDEERLKNWFREEDGQGADLSSQIHLARALRNATVHGALSATKVQQLGLVAPLNALVDMMTAVDRQLFAVLAADDA